MKRKVLVSIGLVVAAGLLSILHRSQASPVTTAEAVPTACATALAPGTERNGRDREIARLQQQAREGITAKPALERLGYFYVSRARTTSDAGDYKLAEAAAECLESRHPGDAQALLLRGHVLHQLHRFRDAEQIARALVAKRNYVLDHGLLGDVLMEQGQLAEAAEAYQRMLDLKPFYQSYTRAAHLRWLKGDLVGAIDSMRLAAASASPRDPESSAWAWTRLAAYELQANRLQQAAEAAGTALGHQPDYPAALLVQGRILLARERSSEAIPLLSRATKLNPLPEYQWTLADALRLEDRNAEAETVEQELVTRGAALDPRTVALYLATRGLQPERAVALAEEELQVRGDIFTLDAHAWALAGNRRHEEALVVIGRALAAGTADARLFLHAGVINAQVGHSREARRWLKRAGELQTMLLPSEATRLATFRHLMN